ncbi:MAG: hypothetical protein JWL84_6161 [Rhodospirillales bacterium]|nr:hypothetical protein [Rhodospirillales bacterium]
MVGGENDLSVGEVFIQREAWKQADPITDGKLGDVLARRIDNTGSLVSQTGRKFYGLHIFVIAPH